MSANGDCGSSGALCLLCVSCSLGISLVTDPSLGRGEAGWGGGVDWPAVPPALLQTRGSLPELVASLFLHLPALLPGTLSPPSLPPHPCHLAKPPPPGATQVPLPPRPSEIRSLPLVTPAHTCSIFLITPPPTVWHYLLYCLAFPLETELPGGRGGTLSDVLEPRAW